MGLFGIFGNKGHSDREAWAQAVIAGYQPGMKIGSTVLEKATDTQIRNDCRVIGESVSIYLESKNEDTKNRRLATAVERQKHLKKLEPYADVDQKKLIRKAWKDMQLLDKAFRMERKEAREDELTALRQQKKQNREDFWTGAAETMMVDEFMDDCSDRIDKKYENGGK